MAESAVAVWWYIIYLALGTALGIGLGFMIARKKAERMVREVLETYGIGGNLSYAPPEVVELALRRAGWPLQVIARGGEES